MLPDAIIIGDSHSDALKAGCDAKGLTTEILRFSGNLWHAGRVSFHRQHGIWVRGNPAGQKRILDLRERFGGLSLISAEVPVIAAMGFHLGRLVPPFGFNRHVTDATGFTADPDSLFASPALVEAYVGSLRTGQIRMAQRMARFGNMTLVVPPKPARRPNYVVIADALAGQLRAAGLRVFDPGIELGAADQTLPDDLWAADGVHGNERYGTAVITLMMEGGLVGHRAA
jgi:hypothetical protein